MGYRTKTYIAGEWDGDSVAIEQLYKWNEGDKWSFHFVDAHKLRQCYDTSMPCTIKASLAARMSCSKTFVLVVGNNTAAAKKGSCAYHDCANKIFDYYYARYKCNVVGKSYSTESFIDYECRLAYEAFQRGEMKIVVLYNSASLNRTKCPSILRYVGTHMEMKSYNDFWKQYMFDYNKVKKAIEG